MGSNQHKKKRRIWQTLAWVLGVWTVLTALFHITGVHEFEGQVQVPVRLECAESAQEKVELPAFPNLPESFRWQSRAVYLTVAGYPKQAGTHACWTPVVFLPSSLAQRIVSNRTMGTAEGLVCHVEPSAPIEGEFIFSDGGRESFTKGSIPQTIIDKNGVRRWTVGMRFKNTLGRDVNVVVRKFDAVYARPLLTEAEVADAFSERWRLIGSQRDDNQAFYGFTLAVIVFGLIALRKQLLPLAWIALQAGIFLVATLIHEWQKRFGSAGATPLPSFHAPAGSSTMARTMPSDEEIREEEEKLRAQLLTAQPDIKDKLPRLGAAPRDYRDVLEIVRAGFRLRVKEGYNKVHLRIQKQVLQQLSNYIEVYKAYSRTQRLSKEDRLEDLDLDRRIAEQEEQIRQLTVRRERQELPPPASVVAPPLAPPDDKTYTYQVLAEELPDKLDRRDAKEEAQRRTAVERVITRLGRQRIKNPAVRKILAKFDINIDDDGDDDK